MIAFFAGKPRPILDTLTMVSSLGVSLDDLPDTFLAMLSVIFTKTRPTIELARGELPLVLLSKATAIPERLFVSLAFVVPDDVAEARSGMDQTRGIDKNTRGEESRISRARSRSRSGASTTRSASRKGAARRVISAAMKAEIVKAAAMKLAQVPAPSEEHVLLLQELALREEQVALRAGENAQLFFICADKAGYDGAGDDESRSTLEDEDEEGDEDGSSVGSFIDDGGERPKSN